MAAALLMMNMHGAVMAADKDLTIFRYSDKVPFAIMVDPTSRFQWEDIIMNYQSEMSLSRESPFSIWCEDFAAYLTVFFNQANADVLNTEADKKVICVGYDAKSMFPQAAILTMLGTEDGIKMEPIAHAVTPQKPVFHQYLGNIGNIRILLGGMSDDIKEQLVQLFANELANVLGNDNAAEALINRYYDDLCTDFESIQLDKQVTSAISDFTVKDMVAMAENLIDTESLQHNSPLTSTREIGIVTMAEGFKWIKHSLYGA